MEHAATTRNNIAQYCANILHGNHTRNTPVVVTVRHTLACLPFYGEEDRINLASQTAEYLQTALGRSHTVHDVIVVCQGKDHIRIIGSIKRL